MREPAEAIASAEHWEGLAAEADRMGDWEEQQLGWPPGANRHKARSYRDAAQACRLEARTGVPHCACCLKPTSHQQPYWKR